MASIEDVYKNMLEERNAVIQPYQEKISVPSTIYADSDMGHFVLNDKNGKSVNFPGLYETVCQDIDEKYKKNDNSDIIITLHYRKIPESTKTYTIGDKTVLVDFKYIPYVNAKNNENEESKTSTESNSCKIM